MANAVGGGLNPDMIARQEAMQAKSEALMMFQMEQNAKNEERSARREMMKSEHEQVMESIKAAFTRAA